MSTIETPEQLGAQVLKSLWKWTYIALMALNFLGELSGFPRALKGASVIFAVMALLHFLIFFDRDRARYLGEYFAIITIPVVLVLTASMLIWLCNLATMTSMLQGAKKLLIQSLNIFVAIAAIYVFRHDALRYTLYAMSITYGFIVARTFVTFGPSSFINSFVNFLLSGGEVHGAMAKLEVHDLTFAFGFYVIYYLVAKGEKRRWYCFAMATVCFLLGYKRIALGGVALAMLLNLLLRLKKPEARLRALYRFGAYMMAFCFAYLLVIRYGVFEWFCNTFGIDSMGRLELYRFIGGYYDVSPTFMGYGIDFVYNMLVGLKDANVPHVSGITAIHNDLLKQYIEIGFWGYFCWTLYELVLHPRWLGERHGYFSAKIYMMLTVYIFFTYLTDNTIYYYHSAFIYRLIPLICAKSFHDQYELGAAKAKTERTVAN